VVIDVNVIFEGEVRLGDRVRIGPNTVIRDSCLDDDTQVMANCHLEGAKVGKQVSIGPFARFRPGAVVADRAKVGNFVEVKKTLIGEGSKVNHLTYLGDTNIGRDVNIGAGTITCNYDGANKHKTIIEDRAFIGSNVSLVAPVRIGEGATIGAGSTIGKDVAAGNLALTRACQKIKEDWPRPVKDRS
jgi:bifunctional UDP-N-acetylglucosamine pyrophosphorylase/glucosamine-1-phosphate N-acetyltransferase